MPGESIEHPVPDLSTGRTPVSLPPRPRENHVSSPPPGPVGTDCGRLRDTRRLPGRVRPSSTRTTIYQASMDPAPPRHPLDEEPPVESPSPWTLSQGKPHSFLPAWEASEQPIPWPRGAPSGRTLAPVTRGDSPIGPFDLPSRLRRSGHSEARRGRAGWGSRRRAARDVFRGWAGGKGGPSRGRADLLVLARLVRDSEER